MFPSSATVLALALEMTFLRHPSVSKVWRVSQHFRRTVNHLGGNRDPREECHRWGQTDLNPGLSVNVE